MLNSNDLQNVQLSHMNQLTVDIEENVEELRDEEYTKKESLMKKSRIFRG